MAMLSLWFVITLVCVFSLLLAMSGALMIGQNADVSLFAYVAVCGTRTDIFLADFNRRLAVPLTFDGAGKGNIQWSPNGDFLAYTTSVGIHMITSTGDIERVTRVADYNIQWIDDTHLLFQRRDEEQGVRYDPFIINIETNDVQPAANSRVASQSIAQNWTSGEFGIMQWDVYEGGTDDFYVVDATEYANIRARFTTDGSACFETEPQFRP
jgi:dipeptidyl aminopeptidase/acylaminoacyl peptidase